MKKNIHILSIYIKKKKSSQQRISSRFNIAIFVARNIITPPDVNVVSMLLFFCVWVFSLFYNVFILTLLFHLRK